MPNKNCIRCKNKFYVRPSLIRNGWGKFCSRICKNESQINRTMVKCATCGTEISRVLSDIKRKSVSKKFFCNKACFAVWKNKTLFIGKQHANWKNGQGSYRATMLRHTLKPVCIDCGLNDLRVLLVHHVDHNRKNNRPKNLRWLCHNCHYLIHDGKTI